MTRIVSALVIALTLGPAGASAQQESPSPSTSSSDLRLQLKRERAIVLPRPSEKTIVRDAEQAGEDARGPARREELIGESRRRPLSRPELDYSVTNSIQADRVRGSLRR